MKVFTPKNLLYCFLGSLIYCLGLNLFIQPAHLYAGGFVGISQLLANILGAFVQTPFNLQPVIYYLLDLILFAFCWKTLGRRMIAVSLTIVTAEALYMALIPIPETPILDETLAAVICGGCIEGIGTAITFYGFGSSGGTDMLGLMLTKRFRNLSVGKVSLAVNFMVYVVAMVRNSVQIAIYSLAAELFCSMMIDRFHKQNNLVSVNIVSDHPREISQFIMNELDRGCTILHGEGAWSGQERLLVISIMSEYELSILKKETARIAPEAFIFIHPNIGVSGDFEKRVA